MGAEFFTLISQNWLPHAPGPTSDAAIKTMADDALEYKSRLAWSRQVHLQQLGLPERS